METPRKKLSIHEVSALRGKFKGKKRATGMAKRYSTQKDLAERQYQEQLAKDLLNHI